MSSPEILSPISTSCVENAKSRDSNDRFIDSSPSPRSSRNPDNSTCLEIQSMLKTKPNQYIIMENSGKHSSNCWNLFGFPSVVDSNGDSKRIDGFVSCRKCFTTYSFKSNSTRLMNQHDCEMSKERNKRLIANGSSSAQRSLSAFYPVQSVTLKSSETIKIKDLQAEWICQSIRPFSIVEDDGLRRLIQECISIGEC